MENKNYSKGHLINVNTLKNVTHIKKKIVNSNKIMLINF